MNKYVYIQLYIFAYWHIENNSAICLIECWKFLGASRDFGVPPDVIEESLTTGLSAADGTPDIVSLPNGIKTRDEESSEWSKREKKKERQKQIEIITGTLPFCKHTGLAKRKEKKKKKKKEKEKEEVNIAK